MNAPLTLKNIQIFRGHILDEFFNFLSLQAYAGKLFNDDDVDDKKHFFNIFARHF